MHTHRGPRAHPLALLISPCRPPCPPCRPPRPRPPSACPRPPAPRPPAPPAPLSASCRSLAQACVQHSRSQHPHPTSHAPTACPCVSIDIAPGHRRGGDGKQRSRGKRREEGEGRGPALGGGHVKHEAVQAGAEEAAEGLHHDGIEHLAAHELVLGDLGAVAGEGLRLANKVRDRVGVHDPGAHDLLGDLGALVELRVVALAPVRESRPLDLDHGRVKLHALCHRLPLFERRRRHRAAHRLRGSRLGRLRLHVLDVVKVRQIRPGQVRVHL
eukprot:2631034-Rhodomonas_salina.3